MQLSANPSQAHGPAVAAKGFEHSLCRGSAKSLAAFSLLPQNLRKALLLRAHKTLAEWLYLTPGLLYWFPVP